MADIFEEIDEDLKQDQVYQWWKKNSRWIIPALIILVLIVGFVYWWQTSQTAKSSQAGVDLRGAVTKIENGDTDAAKQELDKLIAAGGATGMLAGFERAKLAQREGDTKGAIATLETIAADSSIDETYRDRAKFTALMQRMADEEPAALIPEFEALASPGGTYKLSAREMVGVLQSRSGDTAAATETLNGLKEMEDVPRTMLARIEALLVKLEGSN